MKELDLKRVVTLSTVISLLLGGGGGVGTVYVLGRLNPDMTRPDPMTGTRGNELERRIFLLENREIPPLWLKKEVDHIHGEVKINAKAIRELEKRK